MPIGYIFWAIFLIIIILNIVGWRSGPTWPYAWASNVVILILLFLLVGLSLASSCKGVVLATWGFARDAVCPYLDRDTGACLDEPPPRPICKDC